MQGEFNEKVRKLLPRKSVQVTADGSKFWYRHGKLHREDGPAIEGADGTKAWFRNGKLHREDGPAIEDATGFQSWYRNGFEVQPPAQAFAPKPPRMR